MNPLTLVKRIQNINAKEASLGISEDASWHAKYKDSAYVFVGGVPFDLTEGDLLAVFAQYGEIVDVNLVRDKGTGKSKGFAFVAYEDQRSTILAVDNLNGAQILGRTIRVDHVSKYKKKEEEDEETAQKKREERGVCRAFQRGECTRGAECKFSHNKERAANTGWGDSNKDSRWGHDKFEAPKKGERRPSNIPPRPSHASERTVQEGGRDSRSRAQPNELLAYDKLGERGSKKRDENDDEFMPKHRGFDRKEESRTRRHENDDVPPKREDLDRREEKRSRRHDDRGHEQKSRDEDPDRGEERWSKRQKDAGVDLKSRGYPDKREGERSRRYDYDAVEPRPRDNRKEDERVSRRDDDRFEPRSRDNRKEDERLSRRGDDRSEPRSREDNERSGDRRSRMYKA